MRICYLILAHNNPRHLERLISAISSDKDNVYVHVDSRSDLSAFLNMAAENVVFINDRVSVQWAGYSMVQATLNLLNAALAANSEHDYFCLLSGSDYPLRSKDHIKRHLEDNYGREFINLVEMPNESLSKPLSRITTYHMEGGELSRFCLPDFLAYRITHVINKLCFQRDYKKILGGMKPHAGSQWWMLSRPAIHHVMNFVSLHEEFVRYFKNVQVPDESFFQTILGNSTFKGCVARNVTFSDWSRKEGPKPAIMDDEHIRSFVSGKMVVDDAYGKGELLFARKFPENSAELIDAIQKKLW